jgi:hypothetical protein
MIISCFRVAFLIIVCWYDPLRLCHIASLRIIQTSPHMISRSSNSLPNHSISVHRVRHAMRANIILRSNHNYTPPPPWCCSSTRAIASSFLNFLDHTRGTTLSRTPGRVISPIQRPLPDNTQHSQETDIHAPGGTRSHILSSPAAADLHLSPRGRWDRRYELSAIPYVGKDVEQWVWGVL